MKEAGRLKGKEKNRYWEIKLSKFNTQFGMRSFFSNFFWNMLSLFMVLPLYISSKHWAKLNYPEDPNNNADIPYDLFVDIYPGCVYSPFTKGYELKLFKDCDIRNPSLEIGIGDGYFSSLLFHSVSKKLSFGTDLILGTIKSATQYKHCENFVIIDAMEIPLPDNSIETVIMNNLIHHLPERSLVLKEILRVLKEGGRFIFTENTMGWATFTWEQVLLRKLHLNLLAKGILKFKLNLFAQNLLLNSNFYEALSIKNNFKVTKNIPFVSKKAMFLSSLFEFLNLKQGQPTRKGMIFWTKIFGLKKGLRKNTENIIKFCCSMDKSLCEKEGFAFQFIEIEKSKEDQPLNIEEKEKINYICPQCKGNLVSLKDEYLCKSCNIEYPIIDKIPFFISYKENLKGLNLYIQKKQKEKVKKYIT